ncbi:MAG: helix-turn-helix domain-containing protein [Myxococcales bacterium]|nr:helix-turn-helix domain-containing protein [Myxococcales bacterium]
MLALEREPWPGVNGHTQLRYAAGLVRLSALIEPESGTTAFFLWLHKRLGGVTRSRRGQRWEECANDAIADAAVSGAGLMLRYRVALDARRRPQLVSMLLAWILWQAKDLYGSRYGRHDARRAVVADLVPPPVHPPSPCVQVRARLALEHLLRGQRPAERGLLLHAIGHSVAEAARRTGASRQQIYRQRDLFRLEP